MKKGELYEGRIGRFDFPDKGVIDLPEGKITVRQGLPGQKVKVVIHKKRGGKCEGRILEVLEPSPLETADSPCPHFGSCGGCTYQTLPYEEQLKLKETQIKALLDEVCKTYRFEGIQASPAKEEYRNKMEFSFGDEYKDGPLALGMHRRGSFYDIVTTTECKIVAPDFRIILKAVKEYFESRKTSFYKKMQRTGYLRHLLVRRAVHTGEILIDLITTTQEEMDLSPFTAMLLSLPLNGAIAGILHTYNDGLADVIKSDKTEILYGQDFFYEELLGMKFKITPFSFFQTNTLGAEVLYETVREYVGNTKDKVVFDLYSGTGTIAQMLAPVAKKLVGVEIVEEAVQAARENAALNGLKHCEFLAGDVLKVIDELEDKPDIIVLDPPRDGVHRKALEKIIDFGVEKLIYISCKPTSLVRDLAVLQERGYEVEKGVCVDMFPGTTHVETCVLLSHKNS